MTDTRFSLGVRAIVRGGRWIARMAPEPLRTSLHADGIRGLADMCVEARATGGRGALLATGVVELTVLTTVVLAARAGRRAPISRGFPSKPPFRRTDSAMRKLTHDLHQAWRSLLATPGTTLLAAITLALGLGVNTAVFSVLDSLLFRPVPYADADRLVALWSYYAPGRFQIAGQFDAPLVVEWRKQTDLFDRVEAHETRSFILDAPQGASFNLAAPSGAFMVAGSVVTPGLMPMLGVAPALGRLFTDGDGRDGSDRHVIVSDRFWRDRLGRDPSAIGRTIVLDDERYDIVGIMPAAFRYPDEMQELWIPFDVARPPATAKARASFFPTVRLNRGLAVVEADARVAARGEEVNRTAGGDGKSSARLATIGQLFDPRTGRSLWVLGGAVVFLLLIVCANVANLTLARSLARTRDLAVRAALGASRRDLFRVALVEHALLGLAGALLGLAVAQGAIVAVVAALPDEMTLASLNAIDLDWRTIGFLAAAALLTVLAFGVPPALMASRSRVSAVLGSQSRSATGSRAARRVRAALVVVEMALSIVLLVGAALMTRSLLKLQAIDIGMDPQGLVATTLAFPSRGYEDVLARDLAIADIVARVRRDPDVQAASAGGLPPRELMTSMITIGPLQFDDRPGEETKSALLHVFGIWPGYFAAAGIRLIDGREPGERDVEGAAVVSAGFAAKHWPGRSPVGARFTVGKNPPRTIVGVAAEVRRMGEDDDSTQFEIYYPHDQVSGVMTASRPASQIAEFRKILVRSPRPAVLARRLAAIVHDVDPRIVVSSTSLVAHEVADAIARPRVVFLMMAVFAAVGLALAAAGLYGVLSYLVNQRRREIGIRLALGASPREIGRLFLRNGLGLAAVGLVLGLAAAAALVRVMRTLLYDVDPADPVSVGGVVAVLIATAIAAAWGPARRAMRVDPIALLRE